MMPAPMTAPTAAPAFVEIVERRQRDLRELRLRQQLDRDLGDHREQSFASR